MKQYSIWMGRDDIPRRPARILVTYISSSAVKLKLITDILIFCSL